MFEQYPTSSEPPIKSRNPLSNKRILVLGFWVAILSIVGGMAVSLVWGIDFTGPPPPGTPPGGMPDGPVYLQTGAPVDYDEQTGGIKISDALIGKAALGGHDFTGGFNLTTPDIYIGNGRLGTIIREGLITTDDGIKIKSNTGDAYTAIRAGEQADDINYILPIVQGDEDHQYLKIDSIEYGSAQLIWDNPFADALMDITTPANSGIIIDRTNPTSPSISLSTGCADGQVLKWNVNGVSGWSCADDIDTRGGGVYIPPAGCTSAGQVYEWNGSNWVCGTDDTGAGGGGDITDVIAGDGIRITNPGGPQPTVSIMACGENQILKFIFDSDNPAGHWVCRDIIEPVSPIVCPPGQFPQYNGTTWVCATPATNVVTSGPLTGNGTVDSPVTMINTCGAGEVLKYNFDATHLGWTCRPDLNTALPTCGTGQILKFVDPDGAGPLLAQWQCALEQQGFVASRIVGATSEGFDGALNNFGGVNGYERADEKCTIKYPDSHICTTDEVLNTINERSAIPGNDSTLAVISWLDTLPEIDTGDYYWVSAGVAHPSNAVSNNDCFGWTSASPIHGGIVWHIPKEEEINARIPGSFYIAVGMPATIPVELAPYVDFCNVKNKFLCCSR